MSSDQNDEAFKTYYEDMPWVAIPYDKREGIKDLLDTKFEVGGIPTLAIVDADANTVTSDARSLIDKYGSKAFPFTEEHLAGLAEASKKEAARALKKLALEHMPDVLGASAKVLSSLCHHEWRESVCV